MATDIWLGGNLKAFGLPDLSVLIDGDHTKSPWIRQEDIFACGAMVIDDTITDTRAGIADPQQLSALLARATAAGTWPLTWGGAQHKRRTVRRAYLPPHDLARRAL